MGGATDPFVSEPTQPAPVSPAPPSAEVAPASPETPAQPAKAQKSIVKDKTTKDSAAKNAQPKPDASAGKTETLPWAVTPKTAPGETAKSKTDAKTVSEKSGAVPKVGDTKPPAIAAAISPCLNLFEAACRETPECAWLGEIKLEDGDMVAAHCVGRASTPTKKKAQAPQASAPAAKPKPKPEAPAGPATAGSATSGPVVVKTINPAEDGPPPPAANSPVTALPKFPTATNGMAPAKSN
jgi:hypothetical protein